MNYSVFLVVASVAIGAATGKLLRCSEQSFDGLGGALPSSSSSAKYAICSDGVVQEIACPPKHSFDASSRSCIRADEPEQGAIVKVSRQFEELCTNPNEVQILPNPTNCSQYIICFGLEPIEQTCGYGLLFNPELEVCDIPSNVVCGYSCPNVDDPSNPVWLPDARLEDCSRHYLCFQGNPIQFFCSNNLYFDVVSHTCTYPQYTTCSVPGVYCSANGTEVVENPRSCTSYYTCLEGFPHFRSCADGEYFASEMGSCVVGVCPPQTGTTTTMMPTSTVDLTTTVVISTTPSEFPSTEQPTTELPTTTTTDTPDTSSTPTPTITTTEMESTPVATTTETSSSTTPDTSSTPTPTITTTEMESTPVATTTETSSSTTEDLSTTVVITTDTTMLTETSTTTVEPVSTTEAATTTTEVATTELVTTTETTTVEPVSTTEAATTTTEVATTELVTNTETTTTTEITTTTETLSTTDPTTITESTSTTEVTPTIESTTTAEVTTPSTEATTTTTTEATTTTEVTTEITTIEVPTTTEAITTTEATTTEEVTTTTEPTTTIDPLEFCQGISTGAFPYPGNCYQYILCLNSLGVVSECAVNQIFNPDQGTCVAGDRDTCILGQ